MRNDGVFHYISDIKNWDVITIVYNGRDIKQIFKLMSYFTPGCSYIMSINASESCVCPIKIERSYNNHLITIYAGHIGFESIFGAIYDSEKSLFSNYKNSYRHRRDWRHEGYGIYKYKINDRYTAEFIRYDKPNESDKIFGHLSIYDHKKNVRIPLRSGKSDFVYDSEIVTCLDRFTGLYRFERRISRGVI